MKITAKEKKMVLKRRKVQSAKLKIGTQLDQVINYANEIKKAFDEKKKGLGVLRIAFLLGNLGGLCEALGDRTTAKHCYNGAKNYPKIWE